MNPHGLLDAVREHLKDDTEVSSRMDGEKGSTPPWETVTYIAELLGMI